MGSTTGRAAAGWGTPRGSGSVCAVSPGSDSRRPPRGDRPGLTACSLCAGETLGGRDPLEGGQLERLRRLQTEGVAHLTLVECLDECERGDVVVARPSREGRRTDAAPVWFEQVAGDVLTDELGRWLASGGPGAAELPDALRARMIARRGEDTPGAT